MDTTLVVQTFKRIEREQSKWRKYNRLGINLNEVAFVNWNAGGNNSVSALANASFRRRYVARTFFWNNELLIRYGINAQEGQEIRKTDDALIFNSTFGHRKSQFSNWYFSSKLNFLSQFSNGYNYPNRDVPKSRFMAPGYLFLGAGTEYAPRKEDFSLYISPITLKSTFVLDQRLANNGAFGVDKAIYDSEGNIIKEGKNHVGELGILISSTWQKEIYKNMHFSNRVSLYTDYLNSFGNVDVDWEMNLNLVVNSYVRANIGAHIKYDDDVKFKEGLDPLGNTYRYGSRIQLKQVLGVGVTYAF